MNVLFLTLLSFDSIQERNIYTNLLREFAKNGHASYLGNMSGYEYNY